MFRPVGAVLSLIGLAVSLAGLHDLAFRLFVPPRPSSRLTTLSFNESVAYSAVGLLLIGLGVHLLLRRTPTREEQKRAAEQQRQILELAERERRDPETGIWDRNCWRSRYSSHCDEQPRRSDC